MPLNVIAKSEKLNNFQSVSQKQLIFAERLSCDSLQECDYKN